MKRDGQGLLKSLEPAPAREKPERGSPSPLIDAFVIGFLGSALFRMIDLERRPMTHDTNKAPLSHHAEAFGLSENEDLFEQVVEHTFNACSTIRVPRSRQ